MINQLEAVMRDLLAQGYSEDYIMEALEGYRLVNISLERVAVAQAAKPAMYDNALSPSFEQHHGKRQEGDEYYCTDCRKRWDVHEEPPSCES